MRTYFPVNLGQLETLMESGVLSLKNQIGVSPTAEFANVLETTDEDELNLIAALTAADSATGPVVIAVFEAAANVLDAEIGEVQFSADLQLADLECWLLPDLPTDDVSWFGLQETSTVMALLAQAD